MDATSLSLSPQQAAQSIRHAVQLGPVERLPLKQVAGRILREALAASQSHPAFDRVIHHTVAVRRAAWQSGCRRFRKLGLQAPGAPPLRLTDPEGAIDVLAGACLPEGAEVLLYWEDGHETADWIEFTQGLEAAWPQVVQTEGSNARTGKILLSSGTRLGSRELAVAACCGCRELAVTTLPRIALVTFGDDVIDFQEEPGPFQIRNSNAASLYGMMDSFGVARHVEEIHLTSEKLAEGQVFSQIVREKDFLILTGGGLRARNGHLAAMLEGVGVQRQFQGVRQYPGQSFWFGRYPAGALVFSLPGNPVAALVCARRYLQPALEQWLGQEASPKFWATLAQPYRVRQEGTFYLPVTLDCGADAKMQARPWPVSSPGDFFHLINTDGFVELPPGPAEYGAGYNAAYYSWDFWNRP